MDPAKVRAWARFRDRVMGSRNWPRSLWLAAVEDALEAAFGADSRLLSDYRADVGELLRLERVSRGAHQDERRIAELEGRIERLIELADESISGAEGSAAPVAIEAFGWRTWLRAAISSGLGALLFLAGVAGATAFHEFRLAAEVDRQMERMNDLLDQRDAELRADLDQRLSAAQRLHAEMTQLHDQFGADAGQLSTSMAASMRSMIALSDDTVSELERRLTDRGAGVTEAFGRLHARVDALGRGLDEVGQNLSTLEQRLPKLADQVEGVAGNVQQLRTKLDQSRAALDAVKADTPELVSWMEQQKGRFGQDLDEHKAKLDALTTEVQDLESALEQSRARLQGFNQSLDQDLERAKRDGAALEGAAQDPHVTGQQDVVSRAEDEATRKLQGESQQALDDLSQARAAQIAEIARRAAASQAELERTRAGLLASWQTMDQAVAARQSQVLAGLNGYAQTIQARVQDLLKALDVKVAGGNG